MIKPQVTMRALFAFNEISSSNVIFNFQFNSIQFFTSIILLKVNDY